MLEVCLLWLVLFAFWLPSDCPIYSYGISALISSGARINITPTEAIQHLLDSLLQLLTLEQISSILEDCLYNIVSDAVLKVHREEKVARMQSAAIVAEQIHERAKGEGSAANITPAHLQPCATVAEDGKTYLHGNPLRTTQEILCPTCRLPRLTYPTTGKNSRASDPGKDYCAKQPYIDKAGCDIHGKSLALEKPSKKSKAAKDAKKQASPDGSESPNGSPSNGKISDMPAATTIPSAKCPNCPRYMAFTRIAQHMDRCLGLSGRQSSKNAMTKLNTGTPRDSRSGTPKPTIVKKRKLEKGSDDDTEEGTPQKKKKAVQKISKEKAINTSLQRVKGAEKRLPGQTSEEITGGDTKTKERDLDASELKNEVQIKPDEASE